jgi:3-hydroxybutyryl-CoA dehydratase
VEGISLFGCRPTNRRLLYLFAGITGDLSANHVNEEAMKKSPYGGRIAHGALLIGYMSACSTMACDATRLAARETPVSLGYDRIRFLSGVEIGDTITVAYRIKEVDPERRRSIAEVEVRDQNGTLAAVANHILKWVPNQA